MDRRSTLLRGINKAHRGIEVAPWFNPLAPKRDGYQCLSLDILDSETLLAKARLDPFILQSTLADIEGVDLVGNAIEIAEIVGKQHPLGTFDYVISSHNFEHLADPIGFLKGCHEVLKPGGIVAMAIPDHRACFDYFRPHTLVTDWLDAYHEHRRRPTPAQVFAHEAYTSYLRSNGTKIPAFAIQDDPKNIFIEGDLAAEYANFLHRKTAGDDGYADAHCSVMSARSFELLIMECRQLGVLQFKVLEISGPVGCEFFARLQAEGPGEGGPLPADEFQALRNGLLHKIADENAVAYVQRTNGHYQTATAQSAIALRRAGAIASRLMRDPRGATRAIRRRVNAWTSR